MLNINSSMYKINGVDTSNVQKVSSEILNANQAKPVEVKAIDYSKFNRAILGIDLYSSRTNTDVQKQIALTQAGLYAKAIDVAQLNSMAAQNLYSASTVQKNVEMAQSTQINELVAPKQLEKQTQKVQLFNIFDKNSHSSNANGFNPFNEESEEAKKEESEKDTSIRLFA